MIWWLRSSFGSLTFSGLIFLSAAVAVASIFW